MNIRNYIEGSFPGRDFREWRRENSLLRLFQHQKHFSLLPPLSSLLENSSSKIPLQKSIYFLRDTLNEPLQRRNREAAAGKGDETVVLHGVEGA